MFTLKQAILAKEINPKTNVVVFYMDMRAFGKSWWRYFQKAKKLGVRFIRCRVPAVEENLDNQSLNLHYEAEDGSYLTETADIVVLACGQVQNESTRKLAKVCNIATDDYGFAVTQKLNIVKTSREGVFACGAFAEPRDIASSVVTASAAVAEATALLKIPPHREIKQPEKSNKNETAIFLFSSGLEGIIDSHSLHEALKERKHKELLLFESEHYASLPESIEATTKKIQQANIAKVVIVGSLPYFVEALYESSLSSAGLSINNLSFVDLRPIVRTKIDKKTAINYAASLISSALTTLHLGKDYVPKHQSVTPSALVIGGGVCGITASLYLSNLGIRNTLLTKDEQLGGNIEKACATESEKDVRTFLDNLITSIEKRSNIKILKGASITQFSGSAGRFLAEFSNGEKDSFGAVIVATGAKEYIPKETDFPKSDKIVTQSQLEKLLSENNFKAKTVVMIQCVGSLDKKHSYCSKICCTKAVKNAIQLKKANPKCEVYIFYREMMTYGINELKYREAREAGVIFIRYQEEKPPKVTTHNEKLSVTVFDPLIGADVSVNSDLVVLSTGIVAEDNKALSDCFNLKLGEDGFFEEADSRFRPVETDIPGVFIAGMAQSPQSLSEAICQGKAAAVRAATVTLREHLNGYQSSSIVTDRWCVGCELCVKTCPVNARSIDAKTRKAVVAEHLCVACGACATICPSAATELTRLDDRQIMSAISDLVT